MRSLVILTALLVVACSHSTATTTPRGTWHGQDTLANVPADTPYLFAWLEAPPEAVRQRLMGNFDAWVVPKINESASIPLDQRLEMPPAKRALLGIMDAMRGTDPKLYWENLGFKHNGQWIMYGLGIWPVLRVEVSDANKLRAILADAVKTLNMPQLQQKEQDGVSYWVASKDGFSGIVSVTDRDAVVAMVPTASLAESVPLVVGTKHVANSLRDSGEIGKVMASHHLTQHLIAYLDSHHVVDALERKDAFATTSIFSAPACHADYERIAAALPRIVFGYEKLDASGFMASFAFETSPEVAKQLAALHTTMPAPPDAAHALISLVVAADVDAGIETLHGWLQGMFDHPFQCPQLDVKSMVLMALEATRNLVPAELHGIRGGELVVDDATEKPPSGSGYILIAGDQVAMMISQALQKIPGLGGLTVAPDGQPLALPVSMLGIDGLRSAHVALHTGRAALAVGDQSKTEVSTALAAPNAAKSPLALLTWDIAKFMKQMPSVMNEENRTNLKEFSTMTMALDVREDALVFDVGGTWLK
jgi:hypothetical protein